MIQEIRNRAHKAEGISRLMVKEVHRMTLCNRCRDQPFTIEMGGEAQERCVQDETVAIEISTMFTKFRIGLCRVQTN